MQINQILNNALGINKYQFLVRSPNLSIIATKVIKIVTTTNAERMKYKLATGQLTKTIKT